MRHVAPAWRRLRSWPVWVQAGLGILLVAVLVSPFSEEKSTDVEAGGLAVAAGTGLTLPTAPTTTEVTMAPTTTEVTMAPPTTDVKLAPPTTQVTLAPPRTQVTFASATVVPTTAPPPPPTRLAPTTVAPTTAPPTSDGCHPSYEGECVSPNASDVDCEGGNGNGPEYSGPVRVVGPDEYDLDRDGDGYGCESS